MRISHLAIAASLVCASASSFAQTATPDPGQGASAEGAPVERNASNAAEPSATQPPEPRFFEGEAVIIRLDELDTPPAFRSGESLEDLPQIEGLKKLGRGQRIAANAVLRKDGTLTEIALTEPTGQAEIDRAIVEALLGWKLWPAEKDGQPVFAQIAIDQWLGHMPKRVSGEIPTLPEDARRLGHHGAVTIAANISESGQLADAEVVATSRSPIVDRAVLDAVSQWTFEKPLDFAGQPQSYRTAMTFGLSQLQEGQRSMLEGLKDYSCAAFVSEYDWWRSVNPDADPTNYQLRYLILGATALSTGFTNAVERMDRFNKSWNKTIDVCREKPDRIFIEVFRKA